MIAEPLPHEEQRLREAIVSDPADEFLRLALADYLEFAGRPEEAAAIRLLVELRLIGRQPYKSGARHYVWANYSIANYPKDRSELPEDIYEALVQPVAFRHGNGHSYKAYPSKKAGYRDLAQTLAARSQLGMAAILEAITGGD